MGQPIKREEKVEVKCKECGETITYEDDIVLGVRSSDPEPIRKKVVYLTCINDHTHPYMIETARP